MSQSNQPPSGQGRGESSNDKKSAKKARRLEDKYTVIPFGPTNPPMGTYGGAGTQMTHQNAYYSTPYQSLQYQYYHNQQNTMPHYPQYQMPQMPIEMAQPAPYYPVPQPTGANFNYNYSMNASAGYGYGYSPYTAQVGGGPLGQQYPQQQPQQQPQPQAPIQQEKMPPPSNDNDNKVAQQLNDMERDMKNMIKTLQRKNAGRASTAAPRTTINIEQFNQALNQFEKLTKTIQQQQTQLKQQQQKAPIPLDHLYNNYNYKPQPRQQQVKTSSVPSSVPNSSAFPSSQTLSYQFGPSSSQPSSARASSNPASVQELQQKIKEAHELYRKTKQLCRKMNNATNSDPGSLALNDSPCPNMGAKVAPKSAHKSPNSAGKGKKP